MTDDDVKKQMTEAYDEAKSGFQDWLSEADESFRYYFGDGWDAAGRAAARAKGIPDIDINKIAKQVDSAEGFQRQNEPDIKVYPIEGGDSALCDILNPTVKWVKDNGGTNTEMPLAYKNALICGIGWLAMDVSYEKDVINGDLMFSSESPFSVLPSPYLTKTDLSDCPYVTRYKLADKGALKALFPKHSEAIEAMKSNIENDGIRKFIEVPQARGNQLMVMEYWYRDYVKKAVIINTMNPGDSAVWEGPADQLKAIMQANPHFVKVDSMQPVIKLATLIQDEVVYNGDSPFKMNYYPFIPVFGYFNPAYDEWAMKCYGIVKPLKPLQREKNKRRSAIMQAISTMPNSGWMYQHGAIDDARELRNAGGVSKYLAVNDISKVVPIQPPQFPNGLAMIEQMFDKDFDEVGLNLALIGQLSGSREAASLFNMRRQQGMASIQQLEDNLSDAYRLQGNIIIAMTGTQFTPQKIQRIVGDAVEIPMDFSELVKGATFDCKVDLVANSPTHRYSVSQQIRELQQYGMPIPPEMAIEYLDIPADLKKAAIESIQAQQAQAQSDQQNMMQMKQMELMAKMQGKGLPAPEPQQEETIQ